MFLNDDSALNYSKFVSYVTNVIRFHKLYKSDLNWFKRIWRRIFILHIPLKYKYEITTGIGSSIFNIGDTVSVKHHDFKITKIEPSTNTVWLNSVEWTNINIDIKDIKMIILNTRTHEL